MSSSSFHGKSCAIRDRLAERHGGADEDGSVDALGVLGRQDQPALRPERQADEHRALGLGRVQHRQSVGGELALVVPALGRAVRAPVAAPVERDDPAVAREVRDLHLPVPRVDDRPRRQQEDGRFALAVDLVVEVHAVTFDVARRVGVARARLLGRRRLQLDGHCRSFRKASIHVEQLGVPGLDVPEPLDDDPDVERHDERDERVERHLDAELAMRLLEGLGEHRAPLPVHAREALAQVRLVPRERLELEPDLLVGDVFAHEVAHRRPPLLEEGHVGGVHVALPRDQALGEPFERPHEQVLDGAEVVVDEAVVDARLFGQAPRRDAWIAGVEEHALGRVEESLLGGRARSRDPRYVHAQSAFTIFQPSGVRTS